MCAVLRLRSTTPYSCILEMWDANENTVTYYLTIQLFILCLPMRWFVWFAACACVCMCRDMCVNYCVIHQTAAPHLTLLTLVVIEAVLISIRFLHTLIYIPACHAYWSHVFHSLGGGGVELTENYPRWKTQFAALDSYQQMQSSLNKLVECKFKRLNWEHWAYCANGYLEPSRDRVDM